MGSSTITSQIIAGVITGVIAGVSAGLILSALFYVQQRINRSIERRDQITYIRQIVEKFQKDVLAAQWLAESDDPLLANTPDIVSQGRLAILAHTYGEIVKTLEGRASTLSFDEKEQVLDAFSIYRIVLEKPFGERRLLLREAHYHDMFDKLEAIEWLKVEKVDRTPIGPRPP